MAINGEKPILALILAAGQGTRMKSDTPKVLHNLCGMPMIDHVVATAQRLSPEKICLVVGFKSALVRKHLGDDIDYIMQKERLALAMQ